jgi:hypothetical protein
MDFEKDLATPGHLPCPGLTRIYQFCPRGHQHLRKAFDGITRCRSDLWHPP